MRLQLAFGHEAAVVALRARERPLARVFSLHVLLQRAIGSGLVLAVLAGPGARRRRGVGGLHARRGARRGVFPAPTARSDRRLRATRDAKAERGGAAGCTPWRGDWRTTRESLLTAPLIQAAPRAVIETLEKRPSQRRELFSGDATRSWALAMRPGGMSRIE